MSIFADFYDENKNKDANNAESEKARHNKEVLQYATAGVALVTGICAMVLASKKLYDEFK